MTERQKVLEIRKFLEQLNKWKAEEPPKSTRVKNIEAARSYVLLLQENYNAETL